MSIPNHPRVLLCTTLLLGGGPPALLPAAPSPTALEPLVVTAERSTGSTLQAKDLDLFQTDSVANLSGLVPNFAVITSDSRGYGDILSMRGSANTLFFSPPAVGMMVDDVPMGDTCSYQAGLLDVDQVKILRGPQGAIYGRNGAAGMLDMSTPRPGLTTQSQLTTEYGSYDAWGARLSSSGPLGAGFSQTFQLYHQERSGFINDPTLGRAIDDRSITGGLANVFWKPDADSELRLRVLVERADDGGQRLSLLGSPDPFTVGSEIAGKSVTERHQISLHWSTEGTWGRLKSITAWQDWKVDPSVTDLDLTASFPGYASSSTILQNQRLWSQEFRWESPQDASPWSWRSGVFFMNQASNGDATRAFPAQVAPGVWMPFAERTLYNLDQWNLAAYGRASYALTSALSLQAGARLEYVDVAIDRSKTDSFFTTSVVNDSLGACYFSPEVGATYAVSDSTRLFARSAIGTKPAGFSAFASTADTAHYGEERAWTNELGAEVTLPAAHLTASLTGFANRIDDYQVNRGAVFSTDFYTVNAGRVDSLGLETELRWKPLDGVTLQGSAGYVNAQFEGAAFDGNAVPFVPEFTGCLGARYDFPKGFYLQTSLRLTGPTYFDEANNKSYRQSSYACWDAEIGYAAGDFALALFSRNLLDKQYYTFINPQINAGAPGDPQTIGVRASVTF